MKHILSCILLVMVGLTSLCAPVLAGGFLSDFAGPLTKKGGYGDEKAYTFDQLKQDNKIIDNVKALFYPDPGSGDSPIWAFLRTAGVAIFFVLLVWTGFQFVMHADNADKINQLKMNLLYIILGAAIFFLARWILTKLLNVSDIKGIFGDKESLSSKANDTFLIVLAFLKTLGFFLAVFLIAWYGFQIVTAIGEEDKISAARQGIINVVLALIFIKIIDYIYYLAYNGNFATGAIGFIVGASKFLAYLIGAAFVLALIYAGYLMITSTGEDDNIDKAKNIVKSVAIIGLLVLLFLLVIHQIFKDIYA